MTDRQITKAEDGCEPDASDEPRKDYLETVLADADVQVLHVTEPRLPPRRPRPVVVVHAGPDACAPDQHVAELAAVKATAIAGYKLLLKRTAALDVVEATIRQLEAFHRGQCQNSDGSDAILEADAIVYENGESKVGSIGGIQKYRHPITLAKRVLKNKQDLMIIGAKAIDLEELVLAEDGNCIARGSCECSTEDSSLSEFYCTSQICDLYECKGVWKPDCKKAVLIKEDKDAQYKLKVLGAAVYDSNHEQACGTMAFRSRFFGRLSATGLVPGCGAYSESQGGCGCVAGVDEWIYTQAPARDMVEAMRLAPDARAAMHCAIDELTRRADSDGFGAIAIDRNGAPHVYATADIFPWAFVDGGKVFFGCCKGEFFCEKIEGLEDPFGCFCNREEDAP